MKPWVITPVCFQRENNLWKTFPIIFPVRWKTAQWKRPWIYICSKNSKSSRNNLSVICFYVSHHLITCLIGNQFLLWFYFSLSPWFFFAFCSWSKLAFVLCRHHLIFHQRLHLYFHTRSLFCLRFLFLYHYFSHFLYNVLTIFSNDWRIFFNRYLVTDTL